MWGLPNRQVRRRRRVVETTGGRASFQFLSRPPHAELEVAFVHAFRSRVPRGALHRPSHKRSMLADAPRTASFLSPTRRARALEPVR